MCLYICTPSRQVFVTPSGLSSWAPVTMPSLATLANVTELAEGAEAAVFQPLIPQNYSSDQPGSALHGC